MKRSRREKRQDDFFRVRLFRQNGREFIDFPESIVSYTQGIHSSALGILEILCVCVRVSGFLDLLLVVSPREWCFHRFSQEQFQSKYFHSNLLLSVISDSICFASLSSQEKGQ
jgi:hypothetical protein